MANPVTSKPPHLERHQATVLRTDDHGQDEVVVNYIAYLLSPRVYDARRIRT